MLTRNRPDGIGNPTRITNSSEGYEISPHDSTSKIYTYNDIGRVSRKVTKSSGTFLCRCLFLSLRCSQNSIHQLTSDVMAGKTHNAFLRRAEAEKIDTAIPHDLTINDCEFLMEASLVPDFNTI